MPTHLQSKESALLRKARARRQVKIRLLLLGAGCITLMLLPKTSTILHANSLLPGHLWVTKELLLNTKLCKISLGMDSWVFDKLVQTLVTTQPQLESRYITAHERVAIFLYTCITGLGNRKVQTRFSRG